MMILNRFFILGIFVIASVCVFAQAPQGIPYQAVARNSSGAILASTAISVRFTIRDSVATGTIKYRETFSVTTTSQGMFSVNVGQGSPVTGTFSGINWGTNAKFLQVEMDPAGSTSFIDMGTQQMMSVPYALNSGSLKLRVSATGDTLYSGGGNYVIIPGISAANCFVSAGTITGSSTVGVGTTVALTNTTTGGVWSSSNSGVASVGSTGVVTGVAAGTATISYTKTLACGSATTTLAVTVTTLTIGASYGGGKVAYVFVPGDPGYVAGEVHGLIAANLDLGVAQWGCYGTAEGGTSTALGTGSVNTSIISSACGAGTAARLCYELVVGDYSDWYLPSIGELSKLYTNRFLIGGFTIPADYWSSSGLNDMSALYIIFDTSGSTYSSPKNNTQYVRAIRSF